MVHSHGFLMLQKQFSCFSAFWSHVVLISRNLICKTKSLQVWVFPDQMRAEDIFLAACIKEVETVLVCAFETLGTEEKEIQGYLEIQTAEFRNRD